MGVFWMGYHVLFADISDKPAATIITVRCKALLSVITIVSGGGGKRFPVKELNYNRRHGVIIVMYQTPGIQPDTYFISTVYKTSHNNTGYIWCQNLRVGKR